MKRGATVWIRADASSQIGTGHVMRCLALAQAWQDAVPNPEDSLPAAHFVCAEIPAGLAERLSQEGFGLDRIGAEPGSAEDLDQTLAIVSRSPSPAWVILDGYRFDLAYQRGLRAAGCKLLLMDDCHHLPRYEADVLLNQNLYASGMTYSINPEARLLLGTNFALLRREFRHAPTQKRTGPPTNILVTMGGSDPDNATMKVIEALGCLGVSGVTATVVVGPANPHLEALQQAAAGTANCRMVPPVHNMAERMRQADLAVTAAGSTCWELCRLGVPFVTLVLAENQRRVAAGLAATGVAGTLGENPSASDIITAVRHLLDDPATRNTAIAKGRELIDGLGVWRVLALPARDLGVDLFSGRLSLRRARASDMELFFRWANDPAVRMASYCTEPIALDSHRKWFDKKMASSDSALFVMELDGDPAGQVRYDKMNDGTAEIDFSIDRRFRGMGLGERLVGLSAAEAARVLGTSRVRAWVKQANLPSLGVFRRAGFEESVPEIHEGEPGVRFELQQNGAE